MQTPSSLHFVNVPGVGRIAYAQAGTGLPVLLLHGLGADHAIWRPTVAALSQRFTVYAPDLPGHGQSAHPKRAYTLDFGVAFAAALLDALRLEKAAVIGASMGGMLATALAVRHPQRVQALVLADPAGLGRELARPMRLATVPVIGPLLAFLDMRFGPGLIPSLVHRPERLEPGMAQEIYRMASAPGVRSAALNVLHQGVSPGGMKPALVQLEGFSGLTCPVLVLWGAEDKIIPVAHAELARKALPAAQVHVFLECGHLPFLEEAEASNRLVSAFLRDALAAEGAAAIPASTNEGRSPA